MPVIASKQERQDAEHALDQWLRSDPDMQRLAEGFQEFARDVARQVLLLATPATTEVLLEHLDMSLRFPRLEPAPERHAHDEGVFVSELALLVRRHIHLVEKDGRTGNEEDRERVIAKTLSLAQTVLRASARKLSTNPEPRDNLHRIATVLERDVPVGMTKKRLRSMLARAAIQLDLMEAPAGFSRKSASAQDEALSKIVRDWSRTR